MSSWKEFAFGRGCRTRLRFLARISSFEKSSEFLNLVRVKLFGKELVFVEVGYGCFAVVGHCSGFGNFAGFENFVVFENVAEFEA